MTSLEMRIGALVGFGALGGSAGASRNAGRIVQIVYSATARSFNLVVEHNGKLRRVNGRRARFIEGPLFQFPKAIWVHAWVFDGIVRKGMQPGTVARAKLAHEYEFDDAHFLTFEQEDAERVLEIAQDPRAHMSWGSWGATGRRIRRIYMGIGS